VLAIHPAAQDFHHAHARNATHDEGPLYLTLADASAENHGSNCYVLHSSTDPTWLVVCGKSPSSVREADLENWFHDISVKGRIDKSCFSTRP
jgi:hypothetical protein